MEDDDELFFDFEDHTTLIKNMIPKKYINRLKFLSDRILARYDVEMLK